MIFLNGALALSILVYETLAKRSVILICLNGFGGDMMNEDITPYMYNFSRNGVYINLGIKPTFITYTFPTMFSIATGLYAESHGVVSHNMRANGKVFRLTDKDTFWWDEQGNNVPIWIAATKGAKVAANIHYVAGNVPFQNIMPRFYYENFEQVSISETFKDILARLDEREAYDLIIAYSGEINEVGETTRPQSDKFYQLLSETDRYFKELIERLERVDMLKETDIIVTSGHGQVSTRLDSIIYLDELTSVTLTEGQNGVVGLYYTNNSMDLARQAAREINMASQRRCIAYARDDVPRRYHYSNNYRIADLVVIAYEGWCVKKDKLSTGNFCIGGGEHGYPGEIAHSMNPVFFAAGPSFPSGVELYNVSSVDIYPLLCKILDITHWCGAHNGSLDPFTFNLTTFKFRKFEVGLLALFGITIFIAVLLLVLYFSSPKPKVFRDTKALFVDKTRKSEASFDGEMGG